MADYFILFDFILLIIVWYYFGVWRQINDYLFIYLFKELRKLKVHRQND